MHALSEDSIPRVGTIVISTWLSAASELIASTEIPASNNRFAILLGEFLSFRTERHFWKERKTQLLT